MSDYPEHDKLHNISSLSQAVGEFLDWAADHEGLTLCHHEDPDISSWDGPEGWFPTGQSISTLLAKHFDIDLQKLGEEKDAMVEHMRKMNDDVQETI